MKKNPDEALNILLNHQEKENFPLVPEVEKESMKILLEKMERKMSHSYQIQKSLGRNKING